MISVSAHKIHIFAHLKAWRCNNAVYLHFLTYSSARIRTLQNEASDANPPSKFLTRHHEHPLGLPTERGKWPKMRRVNDRGQHSCDVCREMTSDFTRCTRGCDFDVCTTCYRARLLPNCMLSTTQSEWDNVTA